MRKELSKFKDQRLVFTGIFERFGVRSGWTGTEKTILLLHIKDETGQEVSDNLWFTLGKRFKELELEQGDIVEFCARVKRYVKGYQGFRDDVWDKPVETDYKLSNPTKVRKIDFRKEYFDKYW